MGLSCYGRQLYVRPRYIQLGNKLAQPSQNASPYVERTVMVSGTPGIGISFCAVYLATYFIAHGTRVIYEFHPSNGSDSCWYHFPPHSCQSFQSCHWEVFAFHTHDAETVYLVDGSLPTIPSPVCWCYASAKLVPLANKVSISSLYVPSTVDLRRVASMPIVSGCF